MRVIVQTQADLNALRDTDPTAYRDQLTAILGSCVIRTNAAEYPEDYDSTLQDGDDDYIAPVWVDMDDAATLARLGFQSREQVEGLLGL